MNKYRFLHFFYLFTAFISITILSTVCTAQKALVIVPVADLVGNPLAADNNILHYHNIPVAAANPKQSYACPRLHQLLFNEIVDIIEEKGEEVRINIPNVYYLIPTNTKPQISYWTLKANIIPLKEIENRKLDLRHIPQPIDFNISSSVQQAHLITLLFPWINPTTKQLFSAGTRFVIKPQQTLKDTYIAYLFDPASFAFKEITIPKKICIRSEDLHNRAERIALFVQLLHKWAHPDNGFIPYVWGGCSFINVYKNETFTQQTMSQQPELSYFVRDEIRSNPKNGFDCSGLIARATQICGIPYFFKNTTTLARKLSPLQKNETLQAGDLIWMPGHVMIVSNITENRIIEARGYKAGYGKIHELPLNMTFKGINSYAELLEAYFAKKPIALINKEGELSSTLTDYKLLKLASVWNYR